MSVLFEEKILPYSNGRYILNSYSEIMNNDRTVIESYIKDGKKYIILDWYNGLTSYELGHVIVIAGHNVKLPEELLCEIEVIYEDDDCCNTFLDNLSYRFKDGPIEIKGYDDFYYIPYYTRYGISKKGELLDLRWNKIKKWIINNRGPNKKNIKGGYRLAVAHHDFLGHRHISRHRAIGLVFIKYIKSPINLVINHKDGEPGNDDIDNLEWFTRAQNNQHAYDNNLLPNKTTSVLFWDLETNIITRYDSIMKCARATNKTESFIHVRARKSNIRYSDNIAIKLDDSKPWPEFLPGVRTAAKFRNVLIKNIFTGEIILFDSAAAAEAVTGASRTTIINHCNAKSAFPAYGYNFRFHEDDVTWPIYSNKELEMYRLSARYNLKNNQVATESDMKESDNYSHSVNNTEPYIVDL